MNSYIREKKCEQSKMAGAAIFSTRPKALRPCLEFFLVVAKPCLQEKMQTSQHHLCYSEIQLLIKSLKSLIFSAQTIFFGV
jgi:hypothetical protein